MESNYYRRNFAADTDGSQMSTSLERGENPTSPEIKSAVSNFPLQVNVPASRPTLPSRNSTGPENVTESPSPRLQFASEGFAPLQTLAAGSVNCNDPLPPSCASNRREW